MIGHMRPPALIAAVLAVLLALAAPGAATPRPAAGAQYTVVGLGTLGGSTSHATGVDRAGQAVGYSAVAGDAAGNTATVQVRVRFANK